MSALRTSNHAGLPLQTVIRTPNRARTSRNEDEAETNIVSPADSTFRDSRSRLRLLSRTRCSSTRSRLPCGRQRSRAGNGGMDGSFDLSDHVFEKHAHPYRPARRLRSAASDFAAAHRDHQPPAWPAQQCPYGAGHAGDPTWAHSVGRHLAENFDHASRRVGLRRSGISRQKPRHAARQERHLRLSRR